MPALMCAKTFSTDSIPQRVGTAVIDKNMDRYGYSTRANGNFILDADSDLYSESISDNLMSEELNCCAERFCAGMCCE
ncbi:MAG: hypothetical protein ACI93R_000857 [Flavobacteriales bacterium]|jgi:hypothetical protein